MTLSDYIPKRVGGVLCPTCARVSRLPFVSKLMGMVIMCSFFTAVILVLKPLGVFDPETVWGVVGKGVVFVLMVLLAMPITGWFGRMFVRRLER
jgi:hypothetical protein